MCRDALAQCLRQVVNLERRARWVLAEATRLAGVVIEPAGGVRTYAAGSAVISQDPTGAGLDRHKRRLPVGGLPAYRRRRRRAPDVSGLFRDVLGAAVDRRDDPVPTVEDVVDRPVPEGRALP